MITFDGDRSKKRKWFANKQLAVIKDIDVPAKAVQWDGFTFKVWQQGDLSGGRVTAPMGAVVAISNDDGISLVVSDYWAGGFNSYVPLNIIYYAAEGNTPVIKVFNLTSAEDVAADGNQTVLFAPMLGTSPFGLVGGTTPGPDTVWVQDYACASNLFPFSGAEGFRLSVADNLFIDFNNSGIADFPKYSFDSSVMFYSSDGSNLGGRRTLTLQVGGGEEMAGSIQPLRTAQHLTSNRMVLHQFYYYETYNSKYICAWDFDLPSYTPINLEDMIPVGTMPAGLRAIVLDINVVSTWPMGYYSFLAEDVRTFLHVNNATNTNPLKLSNPAEDWFNDNPGNDNWKLSFSFAVGSTVSVIDSSQFLVLIDSLVDTTVIGDWNMARRMLEQLLPMPNTNYRVPYDSVMFHAHNGNIYTWTRKYGAVYFSATGLFATTISVPTEVSIEQGVRPDITYAGTFETVPLYLCVCNKVKEAIRAVYYGSPFTSWTALPGVAVGQTLMHVRPVRVTPTDIFLLGVIKEQVDVSGVLTDSYFLACLEWYMIEGVPSTDLWSRLGRLPNTVTANDNFSVGLFGVDQLVTDLENYLSQPMTLPQTPVGPYAKYYIGMP